MEKNYLQEELMAQSQPGRSNENKTTQGPRKTILVVDDEYINYVYLYELLKTGDNEVIHAINGQDAVDKCMENKEISLVLMDIRMPVMDGRTAATAIKKFRKGIPIIAQTAYAFEDGFNMDVFDDYLTKPVRKEALKEKISRFI